MYKRQALRELREELGVTAAPADLHECGLRRFRFEAEFHLSLIHIFRKRRRED